MRIVLGSSRLRRMFTGLVERSLQVLRVETQAAGLRVTTENPYADIVLGESIALNGACLTVAEVTLEALAFDLSPETLERTTFGTFFPDRHPEYVHSERALQVGARLGGHFVTGHVDARSRVVSREGDADGCALSVALEPAARPWLVEKGSVTVDGVSLTVNAVEDASFALWLIPHTLAVTQLGQLAPGMEVNVEYDMLGKYAVQAMQLSGGFSGGILQNAP